MNEIKLLGYSESFIKKNGVWLWSDGTHVNDELVKGSKWIEWNEYIDKDDDEVVIGILDGCLSIELYTIDINFYSKSNNSKESKESILDKLCELVFIKSCIISLEDREAIEALELASIESDSLA